MFPQILRYPTFLFSIAATVSLFGKPPNIILVVADDMGYSDAGCFGGEIQTPVLDSLAENGLRFSQMYSTGRCWPSRAVLMTGYYAQQVGMDPRRGKEWPSWSKLLPLHLKELGYRSYHSGKWHIKGTPVDAETSGFDRSYMITDQDRFFSPERVFLDDEKQPAVERDTGFLLDCGEGRLRDQLSQRACEANGGSTFLHVFGIFRTSFSIACVA